MQKLNEIKKDDDPKKCLRDAAAAAGITVSDQDNAVADIRKNDLAAFTFTRIEDIKIARDGNKVTITVKAGVAMAVGDLAFSTTIEHERGHETLMQLMSRNFRLFFDTLKRAGVADADAQTTLVDNLNKLEQMTSDALDDLSDNGKKGGVQEALAAVLGTKALIVFQNAFDRAIRDGLKLQDALDRAFKVTEKQLSDVNVDNVEEKLKTLRKNLDKELLRLEKEVEKEVKKKK